MRGPEPSENSPAASGLNRAAVTGARAAPWILVLGTGQTSLADKVRQGAESVDGGLASAGFNLATFGWRGVDQVVANAFIRASGLQDAALEDAFDKMNQPDREPWATGGWDLRFSTEEDAISGTLGYADAVIVIGGARWTPEFYMRTIPAGILVLPLAGTSAGADFAAGELFDYCHKSAERWGLTPKGLCNAPPHSATADRQSHQERRA